MVLMFIKADEFKNGQKNAVIVQTVDRKQRVTCRDSVKWTQKAMGVYQGNPAGVCLLPN
jgi:hypothetical protein